MDLLDAPNREPAPRKRVSASTIILATALVLVVGLFIFCFLGFRANVEKDVRKEYDEQISTWEDKLEESEEKHEAELEKQTESYEKKLTNLEEKHQNEIDKKDKKIAELEEQIQLLEVKDKISFDEIETEIKAVGKLTTVEYHYTYAGTHEDTEKFFGLDNIFTKNSFIAQWDGVVALGVDLSKVKISFNEDLKVITVNLPNAERFYHDVDETSFKILEEKNNIFNPITIEDKIQFDIKYEEKIFKKIEDNRVLEDAYNNAQTVIENIIRAASQITEEYTIKFVKIN